MEESLAFEMIFRRATGDDPFPYQRRLAQGPWPTALEAATGAGKTAAVVLAWLFRRRFAAPETRQATPRRLVLCLPMRTLVTQTERCVRTWLQNLGLLEPERDRPLQRASGVSVHVLMGGDVDGQFHLHPEADAVLIGTQDMLLSRALNRGYSSSRFLWPWLFALLSNDCLWVFDEVQLMGAGLPTGLQLAGLRRKLGAYGPQHSLFMSATLAPDWLATVDHPAPGPEQVLRLDAADLGEPKLAQRRRAPKALRRAQTVLGKKPSTTLAHEVLQAHVSGTRTLVVLNTVDGALALSRDLKKLLARRSDAPPVVLLHSRFRPGDRDRQVRDATDDAAPGIVVSTQVIEAGVDVSARTLFTQLAPWASLVQRAGRCNRRGEDPEATVFWIDMEDGAAAAPYEEEELRSAHDELQRLTDFNPEAIEAAGVKLSQPQPGHVLRRRDLQDLFDTTAELGGQDIDVSRFIREGDDRDARVFWRAVERPGEAEPRPQRDELCAVPIHKLRDWLTPERAAFRWDPIDRQWTPVRAADLFPGGTYLLPASLGGYHAEIGWAPEEKTPVPPILLRDLADPEPEEALDGDPLCELRVRVSLVDHASDTAQEAQRITAALALPELPTATLVLAARAHDLGKAHEVFQDTMRRAGAPATELWAKSDKLGLRHERRGFRHELASALGWLQHGPEGDRDLVAYLLAAHHGKVRLSLRALPGDAPPTDRATALHARGVWDGDPLPAVALGDGLRLPEMKLKLAPMLLGRAGGAASWSERVLALLQHYGPFRLAYLEALVRAADVRASMRREAQDTEPAR